MNSREKGKRGERQWRDELRANGFTARRGQQFSGSPDSPDVVCDELSFIHFEVKAVERLNIEDAMEQARRDSQAGVTSDQSSVKKVPMVAHKRNFRPWLVTMEAETFFRILRGDFIAETAKSAEQRREQNFGTRTTASLPTTKNNQKEPEKSYEDKSQQQ